MKIKAYAVCGTTRHGNLYITKDVHGGYLIFEKKKDALKAFEGAGEHIEMITLGVGE